MELPGSVASRRRDARAGASMAAHVTDRLTARLRARARPTAPQTGCCSEAECRCSVSRRGGRRREGGRKGVVNLTPRTFAVRKLRRERLPGSHLDRTCVEHRVRGIEHLDTYRRSWPANLAGGKALRTSPLARSPCASYGANACQGHTSAGTCRASCERRGGRPRWRRIRPLTARWAASRAVSAERCAERCTER
jgi:hypothetical protein